MPYQITSVYKCLPAIFACVGLAYVAAHVLSEALSRGELFATRGALIKGGPPAGVSARRPTRGDHQSPGVPLELEQRPGIRRLSLIS